MSITLRGLFAPALFVALAAGQAQAAQLTLDGLTLDSSLLNSDFTTTSTFADGTNFVILAQIPDVADITGTGSAIYSPLAITVDVGSSIYHVDLSGGGVSLWLWDTTNTLTSTNMVSIFWGSTGISPEYTDSTPPNFSAELPPTSVVFSGYVGSLPGFSSVELPLISGGGGEIECGEGGDDPACGTQYLVLGYEPGVNASLSTPEPGTLVLLGAGLLALGSLRRRRAS